MSKPQARVRSSATPPLVTCSAAEAQKKARHRLESGARTRADMHSLACKACNGSCCAPIIAQSASERDLFVLQSMHKHMNMREIFVCC